MFSFSPSPMLYTSVFQHTKGSPRRCVTASPSNTDQTNLGNWEFTFNSG
ncbi:hypothetical protein CIPAW_13G024600 [Carya illinoinensis]|uniref:Uncharacterized protein n=1 Tax=Carya illinoinensis TaxID=32201 RepID=A0A8T1NNM4_CARIL|nr:hypothetical protein CIPAW_13G024600 [Carya illinoinensis]